MLDREKALDKAKIQLMGHPDTAFFTSVCFSLIHIWDDTIPTAETDGLSIWYNTQFFMNLSEEERLFLLLHETLHVALRHMTRLNGRDRSRWNQAADYTINAMLINRGFKMPKGGLYDAMYEGMGSEEIYDLLSSDSPTSPWDDLIPGGDNEASADTDAAIDDILIRANLQSQISKDKAGSVPQEIQLYINSLLTPKLPWHRIFARYMAKFSKSGYSWRKPNRRFFPKHYLPSRYSTSLCDIAMGMDISASVQVHQFEQFVAEAHSVIKKHKPDNLTLIQFDTVIKSVTNIKTAKDLMNVKFFGRGGTRIKPIIDWAVENKPSLLVIFTDGGFHNSLPNPGVPVVWIINDNPGYVPPWGTTIHLSTKLRNVA